MLTLTSIFLSHSHSDKLFVRKLASDLKKFGVKVWIDEAEIKLGDSLIEKIREGIDKMEYLAVILSPDSVKSEWVKKEVDVAMNQEIEGRKVKVLPLIIKNCRIPGFLKGKLYADFRDDEKYQAGVEKVLERLGIAVSNIKKSMYLNLVNNTLKLQGKSGYFFGKTLLVLMSTIYGYPLYRPFYYTFPKEDSLSIRKGLIEAFKVVHRERESNRKSFWVCLGDRAIYPHFVEDDIPFLVNDFQTNVSMFGKLMRSKDRKTRVPSHFREADKFASVLVNLVLQRDGYAIGVPLYEHPEQQEITWLLFDGTNLFMADLVSSYGPEGEDWVKFWIRKDSACIVYHACLGLHFEGYNSLFGATLIVKGFKDSMKKIEEMKNKQLEVWFVPLYDHLDRKEVERISQLCENFEKKIVKIDRSIKFTLVNKENLTEMLKNRDLRFFIDHYRSIKFGRS